MKSDATSPMAVTPQCVVALTWTLKDTLGEELDTLGEPAEVLLGGSAPDAVMGPAAVLSEVLLRVPMTSSAVWSISVGDLSFLLMLPLNRRRSRETLLVRQQRPVTNTPQTQHATLTLQRLPAINRVLLKLFTAKLRTNLTQTLDNLVALLRR